MCLIAIAGSAENDLNERGRFRNARMYARILQKSFLKNPGSGYSSLAERSALITVPDMPRATSAARFEAEASMRPHHTIFAVLASNRLLMRKATRDVISTGIEVPTIGESRNASAGSGVTNV